MTRINNLGTCCIITSGLKIDSKGVRTYPSHRDFKLGTVQQAALDKLLLGSDYKTLKDNPSHRLTLLQNPLKHKLCYDKLTSKVKDNLKSLKNCLKFVATLNDGMRMFRIGSDLLPMFDHPEYKNLYDNKLLSLIDYNLDSCKNIIDQHNIVVTCHPDQFNVVNSDRESVRLKSFETKCN